MSAACSAASTSQGLSAVVLGRVDEPGLVGGVLAARLIAEAEVAGRLERVLRRVGVAHDLAEVPAELLAALLHALLRAVQVAELVGGADPRQHRVEVALVVRAVDSLEPVLARPLLTHPWVGAQAVGPVDDG